jgi:hypothetical protein
MGRRMAFWGCLSRTWTHRRPAKTSGGARNRPPIGASEASRMPVLGAFVRLAPVGGRRRYAARTEENGESSL